MGIRIGQAEALDLDASKGKHVRALERVAQARKVAYIEKRQTGNTSVTQVKPVDTKGFDSSMMQAINALGAL